MNWLETNSLSLLENMTSKNAEFKINFRVDCTYVL